jgi:hypothetical protein
MPKQTERQESVLHASEAIPIACNLNAIPADVRPAHEALAEQMFKSVVKREELPDGYTFHWWVTNENLQQTAVYIANERLCCPFFRFEIIVKPGKETFALKLTGSTGVKEFLTAQFTLDT